MFTTIYKFTVMLCFLLVALSAQAQSSLVISQQRQLLLNQQKQIIIERQKQAVLNQQKQSILAQQKQAIIGQQKQAILAQQKQAIIGQQKQAILAQQKQAIIGQQKQVVLEQQKQTVMGQQKQAILQQQKQAIIAQQKQAIVAQQRMTIGEQATGAIINGRSGIATDALPLGGAHRSGIGVRASRPGPGTPVNPSGGLPSGGPVNGRAAGGASHGGDGASTVGIAVTDFGVAVAPAPVGGTLTGGGSASDANPSYAGARHGDAPATGAMGPGSFEQNAANVPPIHNQGYPGSTIEPDVESTAGSGGSEAPRLGMDPITAPRKGSNELAGKPTNAVERNAKYWGNWLKKDAWGDCDTGSNENCN